MLFLLKVLRNNLELSSVHYKSKNLPLIFKRLHNTFHSQKNKTHFYSLWIASQNTQVNSKVNIFRKYGSCSIDNTPDFKPSIRHLYHEDCEQAVNVQILAELNAAYAYLAMSAYFGRADVALPGCHGYFLKMHRDELEHTYHLIKYQNLRGGKVKFCPLTSIECMEWDVKKAFEVALELEKLVKEKLIRVHDIAEKHHDLNLMDVIVTRFIDEQERSINEIGRLLARINKMSKCDMCGCSEFLFDREVYETFVKKPRSNIPELDQDLSVYK